MDLALSGPGFFALRAEGDGAGGGGGVYYTRRGQFERSADGRVVSAEGHALQRSGGGDLFVSSADVEVLEDGTVLDGGLPAGRVGVFAPGGAELGGEEGGAGGLRSVGGTLFEMADPSAAGLAPEASGGAGDAPGTLVRQGMVENANVEMAGEMMEMMAAIRQAETGARLVQAYDTLLGQAITTFGRG